MSVKVENRPENRFMILNKLDDLTTDAFKFISKNTGCQNPLVKDLTMTSTELLLDSRAAVKTFNGLSIYEDITLNERVHFQTEAISHLYKLSSLFETIAVLGGDHPSLNELIKEIDAVISQIRNLQKSDIIRSEKGKDQVKKKFSELRRKNFYQEKNYDHEETPEKEINDMKDPMGIADMIFEKR